MSGGAVDGRLLANASSFMRDRERGREPALGIGEGASSRDGDGDTSAGGSDKGTKLDAGRSGDWNAREGGVEDVSRLGRRAGVGDSRYV